MIKIEMTPYEQKDIIDVLNFALEQYKEKNYYENRGMSKYWIIRIEELKKVILGKVNPPSMERGK